MYKYFVHFTCAPVSADGNGVYTLSDPVMSLKQIRELEEYILQDINKVRVKSVKITNFILLEDHQCIYTLENMNLTMVVMDAVMIVIMTHIVVLCVVLLQRIKRLPVMIVRKS